jgi:hypothetical protein
MARTSMMVEDAGVGAGPTRVELEVDWEQEVQEALEADWEAECILKLRPS